MVGLCHKMCEVEGCQFRFRFFRFRVTLNRNRQGFVPSRFRQLCTSLSSRGLPGGFIAAPSRVSNFSARKRDINVSDQLDGMLANPLIKEFTNLLDLGFLPLRIASKFGEQERAGACMHKYMAFQVEAPALQCRAEIATKNITLPYLACRVTLEIATLRKWCTVGATSQPLLTPTSRVIVLWLGSYYFCYKVFRLSSTT